MSRNIDNASQLKIWPDIMFSSGVENYLGSLADVHSIYPGSLSVVLLNSVAATLEFSFVLRANSIDQKMPTNLYNMVVARSCKDNFCVLQSNRMYFVAYGKSELTKLLRGMVSSVVKHRANKFQSEHQILIDKPVNPTLDEMSKAGLLAALDDCCRTIICDEADMVFGDVGLFLSNNTCKPATEVNCRGRLVMHHVGEDF